MRESLILNAVPYRRQEDFIIRLLLFFIGMMDGYHLTVTLKVLSVSELGISEDIVIKHVINHCNV